MGYFLPEKNSLPLKMDGFLKMIFRFGIPYFQRRSVSFREGRSEIRKVEAFWIFMVLMGGSNETK